MEREFHRPIPIPLYEFQVPPDEQKERRLKELMLKLCGGFQDRGIITGGWVNPSYPHNPAIEPMRVLQVSAEAGAIAAIIYEAMILYPREKAFYLARIGTAEVIDREEYISRAGMRARVDGYSTREVRSMNKSIEVTGNYGTMTVDLVDGVVTDYAPSDEGDNYKNITRVNLDEWRERWQVEPCGQLDILDFGYWTDTGYYEPPDEKWRRLCCWG